MKSTYPTIEIATASGSFSAIDLPAAASLARVDLNAMPFLVRVLMENLCRHHNWSAGRTVKKDEVEDFIEASIGSVPLINKREVNTAVLIEDGQTVVIGGVYEFRDRSDIQKVPFLGDIPFLGNLFKKKGKNKEKAELLIFVTPKVLQVAQR